MAKIKLKKILTTVLKISISAGAVWYLLHSLSAEEKDKIISALSSANWVYLGLAFLLFNASKWASAYRLNRYFACIEVLLSQVKNIKLYYLGMFYNLFLPGGIGGDGYKVYYLNKTQNTSVKKLIAATLLDRLSGVVVLGFLALILALLSDLKSFVAGQSVYLVVLAILTFPVFWLIHKRFFASFQKEYFTSLIWGFGVQLSQLVCCYFILKAIGVQAYYIEFLCLFLVSSVVAVLPITIGGVGAREIVMVNGGIIFPILSNDIGLAMAFSILFFTITAISSLWGLVYSVRFK